MAATGGVFVLMVAIMEMHVYDSAEKEDIEEP